ncbi:hypothetical protein [Nocardia bovistercoris]|uniref:Uncharacterized protein n=1 Tax=Nocardia bovistercoris TaxID=2785916 RepID=A0A931IKS0_9NOCA|nr:hypothetical protein [Nocardia bovistercoris]MBH0781435.1 hypothetical protein [Nocardia bovistercoris]
MSTLTRGAFVAIAAAGLTLGASTMATADTGSAGTGSADTRHLVCTIKTILQYGTISAGEAAMYNIPECSLF